ncbi:hypothetical protein DICPUDRAFT_77037 [Dictyostelium purpureum]|uniref:Uncharacterized protein n=1 Tax=Dictyostelium purpureum TaxID=5786 RepID=F0ZFF0_DICPU|nr:uncharacterized protein DICPUDRAFT_77037 [Dictyostelium purpureum]EGC37323.1 hypothetical protein DICPUDRAFT_77037 [Dictyostelium purpureum]|eukprot:XP_003286137.1 hypothetical protein DICPUDRAFT_77037 [Dictyostelium purpureum]
MKILIKTFFSFIAPMEDFIIESDDNTVKFKTRNKKWVKKLHPNDLFSAPMFIRCSFCFKGKIDLNKFILALNESFKDFEMFLTTFKKDNNNDIFICYKENEYKQVLEIEDRPLDLIENSYSKVENLVPTLKTICPIQESGISLHLDGLKMAAFKLSIFENGFCIGYNINHACIDQTGIYYYFKYLSQLYSFGREHLKLKKPEFIDYKSYENKEFQFADTNEAHEYAKKLGFYYKEKAQDNNIFEKNSILFLNFNLREIDNFKKESNETTLSKNDIIIGIIFKLYTFSSHLNENQDFNLKYISSVRKHGNIGEEIMGNIFRYNGISLKVGEIRKMNIIELSKINRKSVNSITIDHFKNDISWFNYIHSLDNYGYFIPTIYGTNISNWNSLDYNKIQFGSSTPFALKTFCRARDATNYLSFDIDKNNNKTITTSISVPNDSIERIINFSKDNNLFSIK